MARFVSASQLEAHTAHNPFGVGGDCVGPTAETVGPAEQVESEVQSEDQRTRGNLDTSNSQTMQASLVVVLVSMFSS